MIKLNVNSEVGVLQRGQIVQDMFTLNPPLPLSEKATHSHAYFSDSSECEETSIVSGPPDRPVCAQSAAAGRTMTRSPAPWLQPSWKDLAGSGSPRVPFSVGCHYRRGELSHAEPTRAHTHIRAHTHWRTRKNERTEAWAWSSEPRPRSWCKEILWWDSLSVLERAGCRGSTLGQYFSSR